MKRLLIATIILAAAGSGCTYNKWETLPVEGHNLSTGPQGGGDTIVPPDPTPSPVIDPSSVCGNGAVEAGEQCDDGNVLAGDGCSDTCQNEVAVTPPPPAVCKAGPADGACSDSSDCCGGLTCYTDCHTGSSFCGQSPPPTCSVQGGACSLDADCTDPDTYCTGLGQCKPRPHIVPLPLPNPHPEVIFEPEATPLTVVSHSPEGDTTGLVVKIEFNKGVKIDSLSKAFTLAGTNVLGNQVDVPGKITLDNFDLTSTHFIFTPDPGTPLVDGHQYCYLIEGGSAPDGVQGMDGSTITEGNNLKDSRPGWRPGYSWCFVPQPIQAGVASH